MLFIFAIFNGQILNTKIMNRLLILFVFSCFITNYAAEAKSTLHQVLPSSWWTGMNYSKVMLTAYGENMSATSASVNYPGVSITKYIDAENSNYLFLELSVSPNAKPGIIKISFTENGRPISEFNFNLQARATTKRTKLSGADIIYQIVPDRFVNGNPKNDAPRNYYERPDRSNPSGIHGGDLMGITEKIDYLISLGVTAIELTPIQESNQFISSYDKWAITDLYKVDSRLGDLTELQYLITSIRARGIKTTQTLVLNQVGKQNFLVKDPAFKSWMPSLEPKTNENSLLHPAIVDPYAAANEQLDARSVWTNIDCPVLNQDDPILKRILVQNSIWWAETAGADALKIDRTYLNSPSLLKAVAEALAADFPDLSLICDYESHQPDKVAYLTQQLQGTTKNLLTGDYPLASVISNAFSEFSDPTNGLMSLYQILARDYNYNTPGNNIIFADNHRSDRLFTIANKEFAQYKMIVSFLLTTRGIPSLTYGTEALMHGEIREGKGFVRADMPGGWALDNVNVFTQSGLSTQQKDAYQFLQSLLTWRKTNPSIHQGKLIHFQPQNGLYVYFRVSNEKPIMVVINNDAFAKKRIEPELYAPYINQLKSARDVLSGESFNDLRNLVLQPKTVTILELNF
jgi:glycosidase